MYTRTKEIRIEPSTLCNYNCIMCARSTFRREKTVMKNSLFELIVRKTRSELPHIDSMTVSGFGEFSLDQEWKYKIEFGKKHFDTIHIVTNLSLLKRDDIDFLLEYVADIRISLYAMTGDVYNRIHNPSRPGIFEEIREKVQYAIGSRKKGQRIVLNYIEIPENAHQTAAWIDFWKNKADLIEVWKPHNWIDGKKYRVPCGHRLTTCGRPFNGPIQVQVDGTVNVCCFDYNGELIIGDLKRQSFNEIFNGAEMGNIQRLHEAGKADAISACSLCDQRDCDDCKKKNMLYNSQYQPIDRIRMTSTEYEVL